MIFRCCLDDTFSRTRAGRSGGICASCKNRFYATLAQMEAQMRAMQQMQAQAAVARGSQQFGLVPKT
jgi:hypothetical protein